MKKIVFLAPLLFFLILTMGASCQKEMNEGTDIMTGTKDIQIQKQATKDLAITKAKEICSTKLASGGDLSRGPCIAEDLMEDWVADVAHSPRQDVDNKPENQCQNFRKGKAKHFVELDTNCQLIRAE